MRRRRLGGRLELLDQCAALGRLSEMCMPQLRDHVPAFRMSCSTVRASHFARGPDRLAALRACRPTSRGTAAKFQATGTGLYSVRVALPAGEVARLNDIRLIPRMPAETCPDA